MNRQFEYKSAMDSLRFTDEQKQQMAARAAEAAEAARKKPRRTARRPLGRIAVIAACAAVLLVASAGATGALRPLADVFAPIFGGGAAQTEVIDRIGYPIGASDTVGGVTITADAIIGDKYNACVVYSIRRDDGEPFVYDGLNNYSTGRLNLSFDLRDVDTGWKGGTSGTSWFFDQVPGDDAVQYVETFSADGAAFGGDVIVRSTFENLSIRTPDEQYVPIAEGKWEMSFQANLEDCALTMGGGETFEQGGMTFTIDEVSLSPIGAMVQYTVDSVVQWSDAPSGRISDQDRRETERYMENVEILITKADGSVLSLASAGGSIKPEDGVTVCSKGELFVTADPAWEIVPLEELESISVGGIVYPISAG